MSAGKWALYALAVMSAITAAFSVLPYGWAHVTATALSAAVTAYTAVTGTVIARSAAKGTAGNA